jgi:hypothetical protein
MDTDLVNYSYRNSGVAIGNRNVALGGITGGTPFPYIGDPLPPLDAPPLTIGTGTGTFSYPPLNPLPAVNVIDNLNVWTNPLGALGEFFNVQYLNVEAVCAVTGRPVKPGEPVLVLDEHIISKTAFMKLLREGFERMMIPRVEKMHEMTDYDS